VDDNTSNSKVLQIKFSQSRTRKVSRAPVAHACNYSYSEAEIRKIEVQSQPQASLQDPILKIPNTEQVPPSGSSGTA
jgi:hypothetical protein